MILPFVRELLADLEHSDSFERVRRHLSGGTGRRRVSGLTFTARGLYLPFFVRAAAAPCVIIVADNKAAEALHAAVLNACDLTGALPSDSVLRLPAHDVLPFENLSPHPEIQETRAATLWKIATGSARLVIAPVEAACMKLFPRDYYRALALHLKLGEEYMPDMLVEHLLSVGYTRVDVVEMPGQVTIRGGIIDVYSPEIDRPVRIDFFGDEIESIRKFDPETQRSSSPLDEALLLPLTETPVTEKLLTAINARLTRAGTAGAALEGGEEPAELLTHVSTRTGEATVFPGWEFFAPVAGANLTLLDLLSASSPTAPRVFIEEPSMVKNQGERWWNKIEQRHERSGIGNLVRPEDIYLSPWDLDARLHKFSGIELDQLGLVDILDADRSDLSEVDFATRPTQRFHGSIPALIDSLNALMKQDARILLTAPNQGEVERLVGLLQEYQLPYRLGSRTDQHGSSTVYSESSYLAGEIRTPVIVKTTIASGVQILDLDKATARQIVIFGAQDLIDDADVTARPPRRGKSKTSAFISDFRDLAVGDYVVHVEHGIAQYCGLRVIEENDAPPLELMILEFADEAKLYVPLTRLDLIQKYPEPEEGQTLADVVDAEAEFVRMVGERHPKSAKPVLVGNCQAGWAVMLLAASRPELVGAIVLNGAPMSYWSGNDGENPMRYAGGLMGGAWSSLLASDLGAGKFDGAHLVQNFENLNPSNTFWGKYYHLWENIDSEPERFLDFERWWGGYYLLNDEEIRWIVNNLFVGNKLAAGEAKLGPGRFFDLKSITSPIIIFASMGDNITPPQQAFNWIADVYRNSDEIKANGQTIVGLVHEDIGHLGIFVSGAVAKKEHAQIIEVLKYIQQLPPGLYGMDIHEAVGLDGATAYEVSLVERKVEDVRQLQKGDRMDEKPFEAVAAVSELTERAYELLVRPMLREMVPEWAAKTARAFHPLRAQRWMFSDKNPMLAGLPYLAFSAKSGRKAASESNPMRQHEKLASDLITASLDLYRDLRDAAREAAFYQIYGSLLSLQVADQRAEIRRDAKFDPRQVLAVRQVLETLEDGDLQEGLTRMALLLAKEGGGTRELSQMARAREILAPARGIKPMSEDEVRRLLHEETIVTEFEPERARQSLPRLIRTREERKIARAYLDRVESGLPLNDRQRALLRDFRERLPAPAKVRAAARKVRQRARRMAPR